MANQALSRRKFLSLAAFASAGATLAACAQPAAPAAPAAAPTAAPATATTAPAAPTTVVAGKEPRKVEFWGVSSPSHEAAVKASAEAFGPGKGLLVDYVRAPSGWPSQLERLNTAMAAGSVPDIVHVKDFHMWNYAWREVALPLDDYFAGSKIDTANFRKSIWDAMHYKGKLFGAPWKGSFVWVQFINHDLFTAAGLDPAKDVPTTWDQLNEVGQKLAATGSGNFGHSFYGLGSGEADFFRFTAYVGQAGGKVLSEGKLTLDTPEANEALQWMHDLIWKSKVAVPPDQIQGVWDLVKSGVVGTWINGLWFVEEALATAPQLKWSLHPIPCHKTCDDVDTPECIMIPKGAKDPQVSWEAIEAFLDPEIDLAHAATQGFTPAYTANLDRFAAASKHPEAFATYAEIGRSPELRPRQWTEGYDELVTTIMPEIQAVWFDQKSVKDGLIAAEQAGNAVLKRIQETGR